MHLYFKIEIFCSILNVFNATFDQFNASRWIKVLISFNIKNLTWPQTLLTVHWCFCKFSQMMPVYHSLVRVLLIYSFIYSGFILIWLVKYFYVAWIFIAVFVLVILVLQQTFFHQLVALFSALFQGTKNIFNRFSFSLSFSYQ